MIVGTEARIEIDRVWYTPTTFRLIDADDTVIERFERERRRAAACSSRRTSSSGWSPTGELAGDVLPPAETVAIMGTLDEVRAQIGLRLPRREVPPQATAPGRAPLS